MFSKEAIDQFAATYYETKEKVMPEHYPDWVAAIDAAIYKGDHTDFNGHFKHYQPVMDEIVKRERERQRIVSQHGLIIFLMIGSEFSDWNDDDVEPTEKCFDCAIEVPEGELINHSDKRMGEIRVCEECLKNIVWQERKDAETI